VAVLGRLHGRAVFGRRVRVLAEHLAAVVPQGARVLDVGCGDGSIAARLGQLRADLSVEGIDVLVRPETAIPVAPFDGTTIPFDDGAFDAVVFVDVLHHTEDPTVLLAEAARVAPGAVVVKDHLADGLLARPTLRLMDYVGNAHHGVALPFNYWPGERWRTALDVVGLRPEVWETDLGLYPAPASWALDRGLHVLFRASATAPSGGSGTPDRS
jgi:SAM-dependent methyltransferase